jgi:hypothetical protein
LVLRTDPRIGTSLEIIEGRLLIGRRVCWQPYRQKNQIGQRVALTVVIEKEKQFFADDGTPDVSAELIKVIGRLWAAVDFVDGVVGIQAPIAEELKGGI